MLEGPARRGRADLGSDGIRADEPAPGAVVQDGARGCTDECTCRDEGGREGVYDGHCIAWGENRIRLGSGLGVVDARLPSASVVV